MYRQILVPLDGSRFGEAALPLALSISRHTGASLHLVTVQEPIPSFAYEEWESAAREWAGTYLEALRERLADRAGGEVTTELRSGQVAEALEEAAEGRGADLVVMASHGRGMFSRVWLGSVADAFVHRTSRPVVLVRPHAHDHPDLAEDVDLRTILLPLDGGTLSELVLPHATELGAHFGARFHLVRVVPYALDIASPYLPHTVQMNRSLVEHARSAAESYLDEHAAALRARGLEVETSVVADAQAGHGILREAERVGADFIAMATHARSGLTRAILGSATDKVLRGAHVPLLILRGTE